MTMSDKLHRFLLENLNVRGEWVKLETTWQEILATSTYPAPIQHVLGEATAAIALLAASLKFKGSLVLQMNDTFPVNMFVAQASSDGAVRAIAQWEGEIDNTASFSDLFLGHNGGKKGTLVISVEQDNSAERYQSIIALDSNSLAETLEKYFMQSEQLPTFFKFVASKNQAAGFMLQSMPDDKPASEMIPEKHLS